MRRALAPIEQRELLGHLRLKRDQFQEAANLALGFTLSVSVDAETAAELLKTHSWQCPARCLE